MPKDKREITKEDIMPLDTYTKNRGELRKNIVDFKKDRRIPLGPYATFYFESYETMLAQIHEFELTSFRNFQNKKLRKVLVVFFYLF